MWLLALAEWEATLIAAIVGGSGAVITAIVTILPHFLPGRTPSAHEESCHKHQLVERVTRMETENARRDERMSNVLRTLDELKVDSKKVLEMVQTLSNDRRRGD